MAQVSDSIAATVTVRAGAALKDLGALSRQARATGASFNEAGRSTAAASSRMSSSVNAASVSAGRFRGTFTDLRSTLTSTSQAMGTFGLAAGIVTGATAALLSAADSASRLNEQVSGAKVTFGAAAGEVQDFATTTASGLGIAESAALKAANQFGAFFKQAGFADRASAKMSTTLVQLAGDLASFKDVDVDSALGAISSGLAGESEPLRRLGVDLRQTKVDAEALASGFATTRDSISETDRVAARYVSLLRQTRDAQTDAARTANEYANTQRRAAGAFEDLKASAGQLVLPGLTDTIEGLTKLATTLSGVETEGNGLGDRLVKGLAGSAFGLVGAVTKQEEASDRLQAAAKKYEDAIGKFGDKSPEAEAAMASLRVEVDAAEKEAIATGKAFESTARATARMREEAAAAVGTIQSFVGAQRAAQDASFAVADSRDRLADAEQSLNELRRRGKVDAEKVVEAEQRVADSSVSVADARLRLSDAERKLGELRAKGPVDAEKVAEAEHRVEDATRSVASARRSLVDAEAELARLRAGPTADESGDANRGVTRAQLAVERAQQRRAEAEKAMQLAGRQGSRAQAEAALDLREAELALAEALDSLADAKQTQIDLNNRGKPGSEALTKAEQEAADARYRLQEATRTQASAEKDAREARAGDPQYAATIASLERDVEGAKRGVEGATRDQNKALADLREARAGDPDFERDLAKATRAVEEAQRGVERASEDLPLAIDSAKRAQENFNAILNEGSEAADALRAKLGLLSAAYAPLLGLGGVRSDFGSLPGGIESRPIVPLGPRARTASGSTATEAPSAALQPEMFAPRMSTYNPAVPSGPTGPTVNMSLVAPHDTETVAQVEYAGRVIGWQLDGSGRR